MRNRSYCNAPVMFLALTPARCNQFLSCGAATYIRKTCANCITHTCVRFSGWLTNSTCECRSATCGARRKFLTSKLAGRDCHENRNHRVGRDRAAAAIVRWHIRLASQRDGSQARGRECSLVAGGCGAATPGRPHSEPGRDGEGFCRARGKSFWRYCRRPCRDDGSKISSREDRRQWAVGFRSQPAFGGRGKLSAAEVQ